MCLVYGVFGFFWGGLDFGMFGIVSCFCLLLISHAIKMTSLKIMALDLEQRKEEGESHIIIEETLQLLNRSSLGLKL